MNKLLSIVVVVLIAVIVWLRMPSAKQQYDRHWAEGDRHSQAGEWGAAVTSFTLAIKYYPDLPANYGSYVNRANAYSMLGRLEPALQDYERAIASFPNQSALELGEVFYNRGAACHKNGRPDLAIADYERAIAIDTTIKSVHNKLAWILATSPDAKLRDGRKALKHALIACEQTGNKNPNYLDTLAAAHAESGDFAQAVTTQKLAISLETDAEDKAALATKLVLYEQQKPYRKEK